MNIFFTEKIVGVVVAIGGRTEVEEPFLSLPCFLLQQIQVESFYRHCLGSIGQNLYQRRNYLNNGLTPIS